MHSCAEQFFKVKAPPCPTLDELLGFYELTWLSEGYTSPEEEARYKEYGREILKKFWEIHSPSFKLPIALERQFFLDVDGVKVMGYIDRVDKLDSGGLSIVDYKTNQELFTADYLDNNMQLTIYQMAAEQLWRLPVEQLTLYHLRTNTPLTVGPRPRDRTDALRGLVLDVAGKIQRLEFPATENTYCPCDFPQHCPYYKHQYLTQSAPKETQGMLPGMAAADAVDRYAALQAQIKELEEKLAAVKQTIIAYCKEQRVNRVFGKGNQATYRLVEKTGFEEADVRGVLEPRGLWNKVLSFDAALLKELLADKDIPEDTKKQITALKKVVSAYPQLYLKQNAAEEQE